MKQIYAVRDAAIEAYGAPMFMVARGEAIRGFGDEALREGSPINNHPADYELYYLGTYDENKGLFITCEPERVARGLDYINRE